MRTLLDLAILLTAWITTTIAGLHIPGLLWISITNLLVALAPPLTVLTINHQTPTDTNQPEAQPNDQQR